MGRAGQNLHFVALSKTKRGEKKIEISAPRFFLFLSFWYYLLAVKVSRTPARSVLEQAARLRLLVGCPVLFFIASFSCFFFFIGIRPCKKRMQKSLRLSERFPVRSCQNGGQTAQNQNQKSQSFLSAAVEATMFAGDEINK